MGDIKRQRKKYLKPSKHWEKERIEEELTLLKDYGLKNKKEIWKMKSLLKNFALQAKRLITLQTKQAAIEKDQLLKKLSSFGLIPETAKLEDVLSLTLKDILGRRLQTLVYKKNLAKSINQARQFIVHEHITLDNRKITTPSFLVSKQEEPLINFASSSPLFDQEHPERIIKLEPKEKQKKEVKKEPKKKPTKKKAKENKKLNKNGKKR